MFDDPNSIEAKLGHLLIPKGFSDTAWERCGELIDELAGPPRRHAWAWSAVTGASLAVLGFGLGHVWGGKLGSFASLPVVGNLALVSETEDVVSVDPAGGRVTDEDGTLMEPWHVHVVKERQFHDSASGEVVRVVQPRRELVLIPVSAF